MFLRMNNCKYDVQGINAQFGYNTANEKNAPCCDTNEESCECKMMMRDKMLNEIRCLTFAINDLGEYLNTHNTDERALCLHREYCKQLRDLKDKYQKVYGPLSIYYPCNKWRWLEDPWPWERSED